MVPASAFRFPSSASVRCAYNVSKGNPLQRWDPADFVVTGGGIDVQVKGSGSLVSRKKNRIEVEIHGADFQLVVNGFDSNRDLYVKASAKEAGDADGET